ncbi:hypothetical protein [Serratia marcescens]|uniref:hypothetical protein n=1 Tax=Serratia marcescens TaxID=615 RepID=UPI0024A68138|nr:hypothetical protein [Serratia marcescens]
MNTRNVNVKTATKAHSKRYGQRRWEIMFFGQGANGSIPMFSRVTAQTAAEAKARFISLLKPVNGYFLGEPVQISETEIKEVNGGGQSLN